MNQDQVREQLKKLLETEDFHVAFTGKKNKKVNGLYKPGQFEIIIHNKNFKTDNELMHTAIHEFAHHVCFSVYKKKSTRAHTNFFWTVFYDLLEKAVEIGIYNRNRSELVKKLSEDIRKIEQQIAELSATLAITVEHLQAAIKEDENGPRIEDVLMHDCQLSRSRQKEIRLYMEKNIVIGNSEVNKIVMQNTDKQSLIIEAFKAGKTIDQIKSIAKAKPVEPEDSYSQLVKEKNRLEKTIDTLTHRLEEVTEQLQES